MRKFTVVAVALLCLGAFAAAQIELKPIDNARNQMFLGYSYLHAGTGGIGAVSGGDVTESAVSMNGFAFGYAHYFTEHLGVVVDMGHNSNNAVNSTGLKYTRSQYMTGLSYRLTHHGFFTPGVHLLGGVENAVFTSPQLGAEYNLTYQGYNAIVGGGVTVDGNLSRHLGVRIAQVDYLYTNHYASSQSSFRYSGGVVLRF